MDNLLFANIRKIRLTALCILQIWLWPQGMLSAQGITLIDFGASAGANSYGLAGWNTLLLGSSMSYTDAGPDGVILTSGFEEYTDFMGVRGTARQFRKGDRIVVTWYNNSGETIPFTSRVSFTDEDNPDGGSLTGNWYTMRRFDDYRFTFSEIQPYSSIKTVFNITNAGVHKTDDIYSVVNVNLSILWNPSTLKEYLVCDKIELLNDADTTAPQKPAGLTATALSDSKIRLNWQPSTDNTGVVEYLVYMNGAVEGYSRENSYTAVFLEPGKSYNFTVTALDRCRNESRNSDPASAVTQSYKGGVNLINPTGVQYLGAFRLPDDFSYAGEAVAFNRDGDGGPGGAGNQDGFGGSLYVTNLNTMEQGMVAEFSIPVPINSVTKNPEDLNAAVMLQPPVNIRPPNVNAWPYVDIWRTGMTYIPAEKRLYSSWGFHYQVGVEKTASISCCDAVNLSGSTKHGAWFVGAVGQPPVDAMLNEYLFALPQTWANTNTNGRALVTGRCRDGGLSGLGPTLYAVNLVGNNTPPAPETELPASTLLKYGTVEGTDEYNFPNSVDGYKLCDAWRDASWVAAGSQSAVMFVGVKGLGNNWYGYQGENMLHDWVIADVPYPNFFETDPDGKGWRANNYRPMAIFYNPADLAAVANGTMNAYQPQPYAALRIDTTIFFGAHRIIHSASYDFENHLLYVTEFDAPSDGRLIIHVFKINSVNPVQSYAINGKVTYANNSQTAISGSKVFLQNNNGDVIDSTVTDGTGNYNFVNRLPGTYNVQAHCLKPWGGVNATDALIALQAYVGMVTLDPLQRLAADVNMDAAISASDALLIARRVVGMDNRFAAGDWIMERYPAIVVNSDITVNITMICVGDVNKSYIPAAVSFAKTAALKTDNNIAVVKNNFVELPVKAERNICVGAVTLFIEYPQKTIELAEINSKLRGFISKSENGIVKFVWNDLNTVQLNMGEEVCRLKFKIIDVGEYNKAKFDLLPNSELADGSGNVLKEISLLIPALASNVITEFTLRNNYPNPFNPSTLIDYTLPVDCFVKIEIYNALGQKVNFVNEELKPAGAYSYVFNADRLSSGVYFYSIDARSVDGARHFRAVKKAVLQK